ncbi:hypothetical protein FNV43_RR03521 [Rhamnella rubrinervis]|uniref:Uncharacterized protein n=1 Tax=Rhamnella rubrinervis TaxID=2594499 RepID=A0A8K0HI50_9ROSA|nr:hypothetical protein FNV43_RR03521 [Rhamnella rubrinervis]
MLSLFNIFELDCHFANIYARTGSSEVPPRVSPRAARQLRPTALETDSASSSSQATRTPKDRSPKVKERRSPRSPVPEKKRPNRITELESQITQLQEDLKKAKDQLRSSESWKKQAQQDAEESKKQLLVLSSKLEESQQQLEDLSASEEARVIELQRSHKTGIEHGSLSFRLYRGIIRLTQLPWHLPIMRFSGLRFSLRW